MLIADDHPLFRQGLADLTRAEARIDLVAGALDPRKGVVACDGWMSKVWQGCG